MPENPYASPEVPRQALSRLPRRRGMPWLLKAAAAMFALLVFIALFVLPNLRFGAGESARRTVCNNNLKQIGLAMQNYVDINGTFPPAYVADADGQPAQSWRVLLLPYMEHANLYELYDPNQPWDSEKNRQVLEQMPHSYRCLSSGREGHTTSYVVVQGKETIFDGGKACHPDSITDGLANTILVVEAPHANIPWTEPRDLNFDELSMRINNGPNSPHSDHPDIMLALLADGTVRQISNTISPQDLRALLTKAGRETVSGEF